MGSVHEAANSFLSSIPDRERKDQKVQVGETMGSIQLLIMPKLVFVLQVVSNGDPVSILCSMGSEGIAAMVYRSGTDFIRY